MFTTPARGRWSVSSLNCGLDILTRFTRSAPTSPVLGETPVHLTIESVHYPMAAPGETIELPNIVVEPYLGDWHGGIDIYRRWRATWYQQAASPEWLHEVHSWQQIQIGSTEDDLRTVVQRFAGQSPPIGRSRSDRACSWSDGIKAVKIAGTLRTIRTRDLAPGKI